jgi:hypothetical protein
MAKVAETYVDRVLGEFRRAICLILDRRGLVRVGERTPRGAPYTWRSSNLQHRGLVRVGKRTRAQVFWVLP